jgi:hypothetical protein
MRRRRDRERLVREGFGEDAQEGPDGEVLIDDDHGGGRRSVVVFVWTATQKGVRSADLSQRVRELIGQVARHDPGQDRAALGRDPRITAAALSPKLVEQILASGHATIVPLDTTPRTTR